MDYTALTKHIANTVGLPQYLSLMHDAIRNDRLSKDEFISVITAIEANAYDAGIEMAQDYED